VRLRLYLYITMRATRPPHDIREPPTPQRWAERLAIPPKTGARRVNNALNWLEENNLIRREARPGAPAKIILLSAAGDKKPYTPREEGRWVNVPLGFWTHGWLLDLPPTSIALLFILLELQGGRDNTHQPVSQQRRREYGLSPASWTEATDVLRQQGLLDVKHTPQGDDEFTYNRIRNAYLIDKDRLSRPPTP
jgi:hypothetical protein